MRHTRPTIRLALLAAFAAAAFSSCGGPYTAKRINQPDAKLILANNLYEKGDYSKAAVEYKDFLAVFAGDERCDFAQYRLAECYRLDKDYALAVVEYGILINDYGYSEYVDDAFYLEGLCSFLQTPRAERDQTKSYEALAKINRFLQVFPDSPRKAEAEKTRLEIYGKLARKDFLNAKLYYKAKHFHAAMIYFDKIIDDYPGVVYVARSHYYKGRILEEDKKVTEAAEEYGSAASSSFDFDEKSDAAERLERLGGDKTGGQ